MKKVKWLQNNNPEVPGLIYKLTPVDEKNAKAVKCAEVVAGNYGSTGNKGCFHRTVSKRKTV